MRLQNFFFFCPYAYEIPDKPRTWYGVLEYIPDPSRLKDIITGFHMILSHGAKLHPAARYWGLERITANQKLVEPLCADLGYAVRKLMLGSSLADSPILAKEDALNGSWRGFIDSLRAAMDKQGEEILDEGIMKKIIDKIAPSAPDVPEAAAITRLLIR